MFKAGFAKAIITPTRGVELDGYFNARPNTGTLDELMVKTALFSDDATIGGVVTFDLEALTEEFYHALENRLLAEGCDYAVNLIYHSTHPHTAPGCSLNSAAPYFHFLLCRATQCVKDARTNLREATLAHAASSDNPFAFNRRYYMTNGKVMTNPGKLNPAIVRPEGPVDTTVTALAVTDVAEQRLMGVLTSICNHTDTIGGTLISADWPGRLERRVQNELGFDLPVLTLVLPAGNVNHCDVSNNAPQDSYTEATRLGNGYGEIIMRLLRQARPVADLVPLRVSSAIIPLSKRTISAEELAAAQQDAAELADTDLTCEITSEDLIVNSAAIRLTVARKTINFAGRESGGVIPSTVRCVKFGRALALVGLPGEPFTEIGLEIKKQSPFPITLPMGLSMGVQPYIPLRECYERGGYEPSILNCGLIPGMAEKLMQEVPALLHD